MHNKIKAFQGLRGLAIFLVFLSHCNYLYNVDGVSQLGAFGGAGVSIFIILSGFLAARKFFEQDRVEGAFVLCKKRWQQFYKLHFITLFMAVPFTLTLLRKDILKWSASLVANATLLQTLVPFSGVYFSFNSVAWFLSLVMVFALLTRVADYVWKRLTVKKAVILLLGVNLLEFLLCYATMGLKCVHWLVYINPVVRFADFLLGGCVFYLSCTLPELKNKSLWNVNLVFTLSLFAIVLFCSLGQKSEYFSTAVWTIPSCLLIATLYNNYQNFLIDGGVNTLVRPK